MADSEFKRQIDVLLREFQLAYRAGQKPKIAGYVSRGPKDPHYIYLSSLIEDDFRARLAMGERPWITDYFELHQLFHARATICRNLGKMLFEGKGALADQLGILDFGKYRATQLAGFGAFGIVLKARQTGQLQDVAVKLAHPTVKSALMRLRTEHDALEDLRKQVSGIPSLVESGWSDRLETEFLILKWIEGETLDAWRKQRRAPEKVFEVCAQLTRIVRDLHRRVRCHGDISPSNVLVTDGAHGVSVKLVDFGNSTGGFVRGFPLTFTAQYTAPELLRDGSVRPSQASDLWSLGVVLIELLTGRYPFGNLSDDMTPKELGVHFEQHPLSLPAIEHAAELRNLITVWLLTDPEKRVLVEAGDILKAIPDVREILAPKTVMGDVAPSRPSLNAAEPTKQDQYPAAQEMVTPGEVEREPVRGRLPTGRRRLRRISFVVWGGVVLVTSLIVASWVQRADKSVPHRSEARTLPTTFPTTVPTTVTNVLGMEFKLIPAGVFTMGSPDDEHAGDDAPGHHANDEKQRAITLRRPFYMSAHDVTCGEFAQYYRDVNKDHPYRTAAEMVSTTRPVATWQHPSFEQHDDHPVVVVSWVEAVAFTKWLSNKEGNTYRLPLEAEWEYACRANAPVYSMFNTGNKLLPNEANFGKNYQGTTSVTTFHANAWGLYDMHGNVWQWCLDRLWDPPYGVVRYPDEMGPDDDRTTPRIARGGAWSSQVDDCRSANHYGRNPNDYSTDVGFRVVAELPFKSRK